MGDGSAHFSANYQIASAALNFALNFFSILRSRFREFLISKLEIVLSSFFKSKNRSSESETLGKLWNFVFIISVIIGEIQDLLVK